MQNVPQADIEAALNNYRTELESFLQNQTPDATVGDVLGSQQIKTVIHEHLPAGLPYQQVTRKLVASTLPDNLRWKFPDLCWLWRASQFSVGSMWYSRQWSEMCRIGASVMRRLWLTDLSGSRKTGGSRSIDRSYGLFRGSPGKIT